MIQHEMHPTLIQLDSALANIHASPRDQGIIELIVSRPGKGERSIHKTRQLSITGGLEGDNWENDCWKTLPNGKPDPEVQIAIINTRLLTAICPDTSRWPLAGDQLYTDLDLSQSNLPIGTRLSVGSTILEITNEPHLGCSQFAERFGKDSLKFTLTPEGRKLNLRGVYAKIVQDGCITKGDTIAKIS